MKVLLYSNYAARKRLYYFTANDFFSHNLKSIAFIS